MRPVRLDLAGFTVFREPTTVDFTDADFFALVGPTGSGKSTVLDAICFALYGTVPRWADRRAIGNALAPSCAEARVRLIFESAGVRYALTRVVRRDGRGTVATKGAALEALRPGEELGEVLAGTPSEVDSAVAELVGLPYEQFTKCVLLPQGDFAAFLHAKPAQRQEILVKLLGVDVYGRIRERATALAATADGQVSAADQALAGLADADDAALAAATSRVSELRRLAADVDEAMPALAAARHQAAVAGSTLAGLDAQITALAVVRPPAALDSVAIAAAAAREAASATRDTVAEAEEREEKLRGELAACADPAELRRLREAHRDRATAVSDAATLVSTVDAATAEHAEAQAAVTAARTAADEAGARLEEARAAYLAAQSADKAAALRVHLRLGEPCPVCAQPVAALPHDPGGPAVSAAEAAGKKAKAALEAANRVLAERDRAARDLDRALAAALARADQLTTRVAELDARLAGAPAAEAIDRELAAVAALQRKLDEAAVSVRTAREAQRTAATAAERAEARLRSAWRDFDMARDAVAPFGPPAADRDDLVAAWKALSRWAAAEAAARQAKRAESAAAVVTAEEAARALRDRIAALFTAAGLASPDEDFARETAVAVERGEAALRRVDERRADAQRLREQRAGYEREAQVARTLAGHLRANNFERWLLAEALDSLVLGASRILRELSGGQYDLGHDKGEFFVVDHHDAGLRRAVRTLSGGETFQASLALALALSEQLADLSSTVSLESILLDEGFGTLDASTLDIVATTLENLAARGDRMVGVVTHVGALADRIPVRFEVRKDARTAHVERVSG
jgi:exonuclease SbcC